MTRQFRLDGAAAQEAVTNKTILTLGLTKHIITITSMNAENNVPLFPPLVMRDCNFRCDIICDPRSNFLASNDRNERSIDD